MKRTKVLLAVESPILRELLSENIEKELDVEVVDESVDPIDLLVAVGRTEADVIIQTWPAGGEMPNILTHLFVEYPELLVIGLPDDSDRAVVCRSTITKTEFPMLGFQELLSQLRPAAVGQVCQANRGRT